MVDNRLRQVLSDQHYTYEDLAKRIGVNKTTVMRWCDGTGAPRVDIAAKIADFLRVELKEIWTMVK